MNLIKYTKIYLLISLLVMVPGIYSLVRYGLNLAVDFTGGSVLVYEMEKPVENREEAEKAIRDSFASQDVEVNEVFFENDQRITVRTSQVDVAKNETVKDEISQKIETANQVSFETVGPAIGKETATRSFTAVLIATVGILLYIAFAFRNVPKPYSSFKFGATAIVAMLHDVLVVLGIFSLLGHFLNVKIDSLFITAVLTIIGFSVHDTIVVFDRIRENLRKMPSSWKFSEVVNYSLLETLNRSLATSLTVILTLSALYLLGGESIKYFSLALLIGIVSGTYSSLFNASPLLVIWEDWKDFRKK